jgi:hypothetical protein
VPGTGALRHKRTLRVLFIVQEGTVLRFALLIPALAERGHAVHIAFVSGKDWQRAGLKNARPPSRSVRLVEELQEQFPQVTYSVPPRRAGSDRWRPIVWAARALADLAVTAHPRYDGTFPRTRTLKRVGKRLPERIAGLEPIGRRLVARAAQRVSTASDPERSRSILRRASRLEDAIPSSREVDDFLRELAPDVVLATGTFRHLSCEVEFLKSARRLRIPGGIFVASWDNLTNKGSLKFTPERVFVWNDVQAREAIELHGIPPDRIRTTGAHVFDDWFRRRPTRSREELLQEVGLDPDQPYVVYLCSSSNVSRGNEVEFVKRWIETLRSSGDDRVRRMGVVVRPHPNVWLAWQDAELDSENAVVWPRQSVHPVAAQARADFFDTLAHSAAVVGINTTAMIEAAILGKSVLTVLSSDFNQESTLHFHHLLAENGGFLHVAANVDEHVEQLRSVLDEDAAGAEQRRRFVESFIRPAGMELPAAPIAASAIEELADVPPPRRLGVATRLLRAVLLLELGLSAGYAAARALRGGGEAAPAAKVSKRAASKVGRPEVESR